VPLKCEFLQKPYTSDELLTSVRRLLDAAAPSARTQA